MSIIRVGLSETKHFSEGYEAIFGKKKPAQATAQPEPQATQGAAEKASATKTTARSRPRKSARKAKK